MTEIIKEEYENGEIVTIKFNPGLTFQDHELDETTEK